MWLVLVLCFGYGLLGYVMVCDGMKRYGMVRNGMIWSGMVCHGNGYVL